MCVGVGDGDEVRFAVAVADSPARFVCDMYTAREQCMYSILVCDTFNSAQECCAEPTEHATRGSSSNRLFHSLVGWMFECLAD